MMDDPVAERGCDYLTPHRMGDDEAGAAPRTICAAAKIFMKTDKLIFGVQRKFDTLLLTFLVPGAILVCFQNITEGYVIDSVFHRYNRGDIVVVVLVVVVEVAITKIDIPRCRRCLSFNQRELVDGPIEKSNFSLPVTLMAGTPDLRT